LTNYLSLPHVKGEDGAAASPVGELPCPRESLFSSISTKAITEVQKATESVAGVKHGPYKYRPALPSVIGKYTAQHSAAEPARHFSRKAGGTLMHFNVFSFCVCLATRIKPTQNIT